MLIPVRYLIDRLRQPRSRADELITLRRRLARQPGPLQVTAEERELAERLAQLRLDLARALNGVQSCSGCAAGKPWPEGRWTGGHCCSSPTDDLFRDDEIAALRLSGTRVADLTPPISDHAGCAFRGPTGCTLSARHRPTVCVRYLCSDLIAELAERGDVQAVLAINDQLHDTFRAFVAARARRLEREELAAIHPGLVDFMG